MTSKDMTFESALKRMPKVLTGSFDPIQHTTIRSLARIAAHELDLYTEREETDIRNAREAKDAHHGRPGESVGEAVVDHRQNQHRTNLRK